MLVTTTAKPPDCRPSIHFYHIAYGAISARRDEPVLNGLYKTTYVVRQNIKRFQQSPAAALIIKSQTLYLIKSECHSASSKVGTGTSVTLIDVMTKSSRTIAYLVGFSKNPITYPVRFNKNPITYPVRFNKNPITFILHRGEQLLMECVGTLPFSFNIMLKNSNEVVAQFQNINMPKANRLDINDTFRLEISHRYIDIRLFLITAALAVDEHMYPDATGHKRKPCK